MSKLKHLKIRYFERTALSEALRLASVGRQRRRRGRWGWMDQEDDLTQAERVRFEQLEKRLKL